MNSKGNIMVGVILLITAVIGVVVVDQVAAPTFTSTTITNEIVGTTVYDGDVDNLANGCPVSAAIFYDNTNATAITADNYTLAPASFPNKSPTYVVTWVSGATFIHNGTNITANYTYGCEYMTDTTTRLIMEYFAVIVGIAVLGLAGAWLYMKGGF